MVISQERVKSEREIDVINILKQKRIHIYDNT